MTRNIAQSTTQVQEPVAQEDGFTLNVSLLEVSDAAGLTNLTDDNCGTTCGACTTNVACCWAIRPEPGRGRHTDGAAAPAALPARLKEAFVTAPPAFRAGATALVRAVARPAPAETPFPDFDDRPLPNAGQEDITASRFAWVRAVWSESALAEAVRHASPDLGAQVETLCASPAPSGRDVRRVGLSLVRYLLRAGHRATPFGLFAGVTTAAFGDRTAAVWGEDHVVVARASAEWLSRLVEQLERSGELLPWLSVMVNSTAFVRDGNLIVPYQDDGRRAVEASIELTSPVRSALAAAEEPVRFKDLAEKLRAEFAGVVPERVHGLLTGLIRRRVLITNLQAPATETDALGYVLAQLDAARAGSLAPLAGTVRDLRAVHAELHQCASADGREAVAARMQRLVPGLRRHPLALDLRLDAHLRLPDEVAREVERAATVLTRLSARPYGGRGLGEYHQRFYERYGIGTMVPLLDVVADSGIGYPDGYPGAPAGARRRRISPRDDVLVRLAQTAALDGHDEVVLTDEMVDALDTAPASSIPTANTCANAGRGPRSPRPAPLRRDQGPRLHRLPQPPPQVHQPGPRGRRPQPHLPAPARPDDAHPARQPQDRTSDLLARLTAACHEMTQLAAHIGDFAPLLTPHAGNADGLTRWIVQVHATDLPHLHTFTRGLERDRDAVNAALTLPYSNGPTEGVNTKTKRIARQMHGRAGFTLLRHRIHLG